jgi:hypothetical protein
MKIRREKIGLFWGGYQWKVCGYKERGNKGEHGRYILYLCMKIEECKPV